MVTFWEVLEEYFSDENSVSDIRPVVRRCWFYDFLGFPLRIWDGQGRLFTAEGNEWMGSIDAAGKNWHTAPSIQDGRDGSSASYTFTVSLTDFPGQTARQTYDALKDNQDLARGRKLTQYLGIFKPDEALRPGTPLIFFKEFLMFSPRFSEKVQMNSDGAMRNIYSVSALAKDNNFGRSNIPGGTYSDTVQKDRAALAGVSLDRGCEFVALLANKTFTIP